jgi:hypothetical protein
MGSRDRRDERPRRTKAALAVGLLMLISACASAPPFQPQSVPDEAALRERAVSKVDGDVRVSATFPTPEEARSIFGVDLGERDILPLWVEIENRGKDRFYFLPTGLDPEYFAPLEAAFLYKGAVADHAALGRHLQALCFDSRRPIASGTTESGFIFINAVEPSLVAQIDLFGWRWSRRISLSVPVPDAEGAHRRAAGLRELYAPADLIGIGDDARLRAALEELPCCTTDAVGTGHGLPLNLVVIGNLEDAGPAFVRRGYRFSPVDPLYALGRAQDLSVRKKTRWVVAQPHTLRFWLTPLRYQGKAVWLGQASSGLGGRFAGPAGDVDTIEPAVDDARNDIVQDLLYSQSVARLGFVNGVGRVAATTPRAAPEGSRYHTDGLRAVMVFRDETVSLSQIDLFEWEVFSPAIAGKRSTAE